MRTRQKFEQPSRLKLPEFAAVYTFEPPRPYLAAVLGLITGLDHGVSSRAPERASDPGTEVQTQRLWRGRCWWLVSPFSPLDLGNQDSARRVVHHIVTDAAHKHLTDGGLVSMPHHHQVSAPGAG